ncbi:MAG TPA: hypothetical protein DC049_07985 [Spirochaetia bacterium]|nr:hypothetical protein [Spirochaetia bacterium]
MNPKFELKQKVKIVATGGEGVVDGIWESVGSVPKYNIVYYDSTGRRAESWLRADELEAM